MDAPPEVCDVIIMGGGLAGLTLALQLKNACADLSVTVLERRTHPVPLATHKVGESSVEIGAHYFSTVFGLKPHLEDGEGSLGVGIAVSHIAATPPGHKVTVTVSCVSVEGRRITWQVRAEDENELIGEGTHQRAIVRWDRFNDKLAAKRGG